MITSLIESGFSYTWLLVSFMIKRAVKLIRDERFNQIISLNKVANEKGKEDATRRLISRSMTIHHNSKELIDNIQLRL